MMNTVNSFDCCSSDLKLSLQHLLLLLPLLLPRLGFD